MGTTLNMVSRRELLRIAGRFGWTSTLFAATAATGLLSTSQLAAAAEDTARQRDRKKARYTFKLGASGFNEENLEIQKAGFLFFAKDLEARTDGEIKVDFIGSNQICGQLNCVQKAQQGIVDIFAASTQNSAGNAPYYNVLDFAYMFPTRASQFYFFYHPKSNALLREPLRKMHNIHFLFTHCALRGMMMGQTFKDRPLVTTLEDIQGTKNRVTGSQLGRIAMQLMQLNPVPIAWEETLDGLRQGLIDGAETWMEAAAYAGMAPVLSQAVDLRFFSGNEHCAMNAEVFDGLEPELQHAVMESAYTAQIFTQGMNQAALYEVVGAYPEPREGTMFKEYGVRVAPLTDAVRAQAAELCAPKNVPDPWETWRERLTQWSGGHDTYQEIHDLAREIPVDTAPINVEPRRWF